MTRSFLIISANDGWQRVQQPLCHGRVWFKRNSLWQIVAEVCPPNTLDVENIPVPQTAEQRLKSVGLRCHSRPQALARRIMFEQAGSSAPATLECVTLGRLGRGQLTRSCRNMLASSRTPSIPPMAIIAIGGLKPCREGCPPPASAGASIGDLARDQHPCDPKPSESIRSLTIPSSPSRWFHRATGHRRTGTGR